MKAILTKIVAPVASAGLLLGTMVAAVNLDWISDEVAFWLWPTLFAVLFLAFSIVALLRGLRLWLWPLGTAFVVQTVGTLILLLSAVFESRWEPLWYTLGAVGLVLLVMLVVFVTSTIRARILERKMAEGTGGSDEDVARIRKDMLEALDLLRRAGRGRNAIYELPWFLVMGRPAAGKTVAIKNSDLGLPVKRDWVKGVGGTYTADWFFTNELIFLDTPGKWVTEGATDDGRKHWRELIKLLRRYRGRQPLDGLIVVVPADDLLSLPDQDLEEQAANIREVVDLIHDELQFRFPVYLLVSKCDLVDGFVDFFKVLPAKRRHEILGWSNSDPNRREADELVEQGFERVRRRLEAYRVEMLARVAKRSQARRLFFFTEEFKGLERPLQLFADAFFQSDRYSEPPVFRGFYFTSGTQEGAPMSKAMAELSRTLGVPVSRGPEVEADEEKKRSYFLLDLFRDLMVGDEGLVGRTTGHWWRRRRNTLLGVFAPAGLAMLFLLLSIISLGLNKSTYGKLETRSPEIVRGLREYASPMGGVLQGNDVEEALELTGRLRAYHVQLAGVSPFRRFGMRRPGALEPETLELFRDQFVRVLLEPTLAAAERLAVSPTEDCIDRIGALRSVVWLRTGRRAGFEDLAGLDRVWDLDSGDRAEQAERVRREFRRQYAYLKTNLTAEDNADLLKSFSVRKAARNIAEVCGQQGATSTLAQYSKWQATCRDAVTDAEVLCCYQDLRKVLRTTGRDYEKLRTDFEKLKIDLDDLRDEVPEAKIGLEALLGIDLAQGQTSECLTQFERKIVPRIEEFAVQEQFIDQCLQEVDKVSKGEKWTVRETVLAMQSEQLKDQEETLNGLMANYGINCDQAVAGFRGLNMVALKNAAESYRRVACFGLPQAPGAACGDVVEAAPIPVVTAPRPAPRTGPPATPRQSSPARPAKAAPAPPGPSPYSFFARPARVKDYYTPTNFASLSANEWALRWEAIKTRRGFTEAQANFKEQELRGDIAGYAAGYVKAWVGYLQSLDLQERAKPVAAWLMELSTSPEWDTLIGKPREAAAIGEAMAEPPFDAGAPKLEPLQGLAGLDLGAYLALLGKIASDLERCEQDPIQWQAYRAQLASGDKNNSLVGALDWVRMNAGPTVVRGALTELLSAPLEQARSHLLSDNLLRAQWQDLWRVYDEQIRGRAPMSADLPGSEPVTLEGLTALLGGETGAVARVRRSTGGQSLSPEAEAWLAEAEVLSRLLFEDASDGLREVRLSVSLQEEIYEPEEFGKAFRLEELKLHMGEGATFHWKLEDERQKTLKVVLFGDDASEFAFVQGGIAERKGRLQRMFGKKWKPGEEVDATTPSGPARVEGPFAPLQVIAAGMADPAEAALRYTIEVPWKKKTDGKVHVDVKLLGKDAGPLLGLLERGLRQPPQSALGS